MAGIGRTWSQGATEWDRYVEEGVSLVSATATLFPADVVEMIVRFPLRPTTMQRRSRAHTCLSSHLSLFFQLPVFMADADVLFQAHVTLHAQAAGSMQCDACTGAAHGCRARVPRTTAAHRRHAVLPASLPFSLLPSLSSSPVHLLYSRPLISARLCVPVFSRWRGEHAPVLRAEGPANAAADAGIDGERVR